MLDHAPNPGSKLQEESIFIYLRQDAFKETIYKGQKSFLVILAQILAAYYLLSLFGVILTYHFNNNKFISDVIKRLYKVKSTSLNNTDAKISAVKISELSDKLDSSRNRKLHAHILTWR